MFGGLSFGSSQASTSARPFSNGPRIGRCFCPQIACSPGVICSESRNSSANREPPLHLWLRIWPYYAKERANGPVTLLSDAEHGRSSSEANCAFARHLTSSPRRHVSESSLRLGPPRLARRRSRSLSNATHRGLPHIGNGPRRLHPNGGTP